MQDMVSPKRGRGRRPAAQVRDEVLHAAGALFLDEGIQAVTFERVAKESGASKTTLYRWWRSPGELVAEAYFAQSQPALEFPDTGNLHADLVTQVSAFVQFLTTHGDGRRLAELVGAAQLDSSLAEAWKHAYSTPRRDLARARLQLAQEQGEISADADIDITIDQLWGACYHRLLVLMVPVADIDVEKLVTYALHGVRSSSSPGPTPENRQL